MRMSHNLSSEESFLLVAGGSAIRTLPIFAGLVTAFRNSLAIRVLET
jgi:hypothetical protein